MPDIHAVCKEAKRMGYDWASLLNADMYRAWEPKQVHFLNALWFSRISHEDEDIDGLVEYSEYDETCSYSPLWYEFIQTSYTTAIRNYADRDLIFAKPVMDSMLRRVPPPADPERLMAFFTTGKGPPLGKGDIINSSGVSVPGNPIENRDGMFVVKWDRVTPHGKGILADHEQFPPWSWDVPTMAVWDTTALTDVIVYRNTGEFQYEPQGVSISNHTEFRESASQVRAMTDGDSAEEAWKKLHALVGRIQMRM